MNWSSPFYLVKGWIIYWISISNVCHSYPIFVILFLKDHRLHGHVRNDFLSFRHLRSRALMFYASSQKNCFAVMFFFSNYFFSKNRSLLGRLTMSHSSLCSLYANLSSTWFCKSCSYRGLGLSVIGEILQVMTPSTTEITLSLKML